MSDKRATFQLFIFGQLGGQLITFAEFDRSRAVERVKPKKKATDDLTKRIRELHEFIETDHPPYGVTELAKLGGDLFDLVLQGKVRALFDMATGASPRLLPFELFVEDYSINSWPWEYMYDPIRRKFLSQEFHPISRGIFALDQKPTLRPVDGKVRILFIIGVLPTDPEATPEAEIQSLRNVFGAWLASQAVHLEIMQAPSPEELAKHLQGNRYDIVHYFGHGGFDLARNGGQGYLRFDRPGKESFRYYAEEFARLLQNKNIRLVFLNACESGRAARAQDPARSSVAAALLDRGIPAVIATQFSIADGTAHFLSSMIYNGLVCGHPLVQAMKDGRDAMSFAEKRKFTDWGIPVLYTSDPDLVIFPQPSATSPAWADEFARAVRQSGVLKALSAPAGPGAPALSVERTVSPDKKLKASMKIALVDFDAKVAFLPDLVEQANRAQQFYHFEVAYLPLPTGAVRTDVPGGEGKPQFYLPMVEEYLRRTPEDLDVNKVCCLTRCWVAGVDEKGRPFDTYRLSALNSTEDVVAISTFKLREYAREAQVSYAKATLYICLSSIVASDTRYDEFIPLTAEGEHPYIHPETAGCLFDNCDNRDDIVVGLRRMRFDHDKCRAKIRDPEHLAAIDALIALEVETNLPGA